ncbi:FAD-binding oxidoreductase [Alcaligenaceae bacterium A4P071]|nr:FAD-binding oxidoreductase [Alcaligenaceae bacterium A4P071]
MSGVTFSLVDGASHDAIPAEWRAHALSDAHRAQLVTLVGEAGVLTAPADRYTYCRDRLPFGTFRLRVGKLPATLPAAIVCPADEAALQAVIAWAVEAQIALIPFGAGSGVLGGTMPLNCEVMVDLKRMNRIVEINEIDGTVTVQAGMNGGQFEAALNARGYTAGHLPQSINMSTVGGWAACRGAGQASSRYGKIEDMVVGLKALLPNAQPLEVRAVARRAVGPSIKDLMVGSEGVFGFITQLTLRMWRLPAHEAGVVLAFPTLQAGFDALREIIQSELRPAVMRLYDEMESQQRTKDIAAFKHKPILCILKFSGLRELAEVEQRLSLAICAAHGGELTDDGPYRHWETTRYQSYSIQWQTGGYYMDTIEVTGTWTGLPHMYAAMSEAVHALHPDIHFGAHWSHIYAEGACQYMTVRLPPMPDDDVALALHRKAWDVVERLCLAHGGSIAHHHGAGLFRNAWLREELNTGMDVLQIIKDGIDPGNLLNPGKLGLRAAPGAIVL